MMIDIVDELMMNDMIVVRNMPVLAQDRTSCVKQCYSICACILYSIVCNPQKKSIVYVYDMRV